MKTAKLINRIISILNVNHSESNKKLAKRIVAFIEWQIKPQKYYILPGNREIEIAADEYEYKAACGFPSSDYVNEDFIAGANYFKSQLKEGYPLEFCEFCIEHVTKRGKYYLVDIWKKAYKTIDELYQYWKTEIIFK